MKRAALSLSLLAAAASCWAETPGLKGVPIGATQAELVRQFPDASCSPVPPAFQRRLGDASCSLYGPKASTYGGVRALEMTAYLVAGRFAGFTVAFGWRDYEPVRDALREVYGQGTETTEMTQNTAGARVASRNWSATVEGIRLNAVENASPLTQAAVSVMGPALLERQRTPATGKPERDL